LEEGAITVHDKEDQYNPKEEVENRELGRGRMGQRETADD
jgi:hypothetical protein